MPLLNDQLYHGHRVYYELRHIMKAHQEKLVLDPKDKIRNAHTEHGIEEKRDSEYFQLIPK
ncbi:hypothetical protein Pyn_19101 [Prunus yedoensis var. nudiflora]|uniref:Uncharacterized protein n=1 Tax=Prunus yedoensis var. nudiflora TaxID=2094558 RepID=A0A314U830_PRUYE|nr:hypothetical protein Pyn_19101 [Prunus yedoensis var. nudiflora]